MLWSSGAKPHCRAAASDVVITVVAVVVIGIVLSAVLWSLTVRIVEATTANSCPCDTPLYRFLQTWAGMDRSCTQLLLPAFV